MNTAERIEWTRLRYSMGESDTDFRSPAPNFGESKGDPIKATCIRELESHGFKSGEDDSMTHEEMPEHKFVMKESEVDPKGLSWEHYDGKGNKVAEGNGRDELIDHATDSLKASRRERADNPDHYGGNAEDAKMEKTMHEFKAGTLHSGSKTGPVVESRKQAIAIGMNSSRK